jgi:hypothetical protein
LADHRWYAGVCREPAGAPLDAVAPSGNRKPPGRCPSSAPGRPDDRLLWSA